MRRFVFLTGKYMPKPGATGVCVHKIAKQLVDNGNCVEVVCYGKKSEVYFVDGIRVHCFKVPFFFLNDMSRLGVLFLRLLKLLNYGSYPLRSHFLVNRYFKVLKHLISLDDDVVITASVSPVEAVASLPMIYSNLRCKSKKLIYYCADTLSNELGNSALLSAKKRVAKGLSLEKKIFRCCDKIIIMKCHENHYFSDEFESFREKMALADFPLFCPNGFQAQQVNERPRLVFAGTLYMNLRNPSQLCDILGKSSKHFTALFIGGGDCSRLMSSISERSRGKISYLGLLTYESCSEHIKNADILLSIGNSESPMMPSKIFEYISTGKPIVHFVLWEKDPCISLLLEYKNALLLYDSSPTSIKAFDDFIANAHSIDASLLETQFEASTPAYSAEIISEVF